MQDETPRRPGRPRTKAKDANEGSKTLRRALNLLRALAARDPAGAKLADLVEATGIHPATAHRLLATLHDEGMVWVDARNNVYNLGFELIKMGGAVHRFAISNHLHPALEQIATILEEDVYLTVPVGNDSIVVDKVEGTLTVRLVSPAVGSRGPLGAGAGAIAMLAGLPAEVGLAVYEANLSRFEGLTWITPEEIWQEVLASRRRGYTVVKKHMIAEATAVAVALTDDSGVVVGAIAVSATNSRMMPERRAEIAQTIIQTVAKFRPLPSDRLTGQLGPTPFHG